jgi:tetratricopeptide (TPR) repeat protein
VGYYRLAQVYVATQDLEKAEKAATRALEADDRCDIFQQAWHLRGQIRAKLGERQEAIADLERCVELGVNNEIGKGCRRLLEATN